MKISFAQLRQHLRGPLSPIYLITGDEVLLVNETLEQLRAAAAQQEYTERIRLSVETTTDWSETFYTHTHNLSLFAAKRVIELNMTTNKLSAPASQALIHYANAPPASTLLLIYTGRLDIKSLHSKWYQAIEKVGSVISIWPVTVEQLPAWIKQRAQQTGLVLNNAFAEQLATAVEGNLLAAAQEIDKLGLLQLSQPLDAHTMAATLTELTHFNIFQWVDAVLIGDSKRCLMISTALKAEGIELAILLWALTRELRVLAQIAHLRHAGNTLESTYQQLAIRSQRQPLVRAFLQRHSLADCRTLLTTAAQLDQTIKGAEIGNGWDELEQLMLSLCTPTPRYRHAH